jgi:hypothetical protein
MDKYLQLKGIAHRARPHTKVGHFQFWEAQEAIAIPNRCFERVQDEINHAHDYHLSLFGNSCSE